MARTETPVQETEAAPAASPSTEAAPAVAATAATKAPKKDKAPIPEGWATPVAFHHMLNKRDKEAGLAGDMRPQIIYGYVKNSKLFPHKLNTDGAVIVNVEEAFKFIDDLRARKVTRDAEKAAKAAAPAPAPAAAS